MRTKIIFSIVLVTILLATQVIAVGAAPATQEDTPPITGTVESITIETDTESGEKTVVVTLTDESGETQTVRLSLAYADTLGLIGENGEPVDPDILVVPVEIDPEQVIADTPEEPDEEAQHPVGSALSDFFSELLGVDYDTIMEHHDDGVGFGVIAQALWMTNALVSDEDTEMEMTPEELFAAILEAKQNHDYGDIVLPDGSTPENWGQFRKAVMSDREKAKENLGAIMSGRAEDGQGEEVQNQEEIQTQEELQTQNQVQGNGNGLGIGNGNNGVGAGNNSNSNNGNGNGPQKEKTNNGKNNKDKGKGNPH